MGFVGTSFIPTCKCGLLLYPLQLFKERAREVFRPRAEPRERVFLSGEPCGNHGPPGYTLSPRGRRRLYCRSAGCTSPAANGCQVGFAGARGTKRKRHRKSLHSREETTKGPGHQTGQRTGTAGAPDDSGPLAWPRRVLLFSELPWIRQR